jgi:hypothetical protein
MLIFDYSGVLVKPTFPGSPLSQLGKRRLGLIRIRRLRGRLWRWLRSACQAQQAVAQVYSVFAAHYEFVAPWYDEGPTR